MRSGFAREGVSDRTQTRARLDHKQEPTAHEVEQQESAATAITYDRLQRATGRPSSRDRRTRSGPYEPTLPLSPRIAESKVTGEGMRTGLEPDENATKMRPGPSWEAQNLASPRR
jgi:hypothetical protein